MVVLVLLLQSRVLWLPMRVAVVVQQTQELMELVVLVAVEGVLAMVMPPPLLGLQILEVVAVAELVLHTLPA
jgi:hypothetical protein